VWRWSSPASRRSGADTSSGGRALAPEAPAKFQIDPYEILADVLQLVGQHPASRTHELTPRLWKQLFADNPLRSTLHTISAL
jgi:hypothetical protein